MNLLVSNKIISLFLAIIKRSPRESHKKYFPQREKKITHVVSMTHPQSMHVHDITVKCVSYLWEFLLPLCCCCDFLLPFVDKLVQHSHNSQPYATQQTNTVTPKTITVTATIRELFLCISIHTETFYSFIQLQRLNLFAPRRGGMLYVYTHIHTQTHTQAQPECIRQQQKMLRETLCHLEYI